MKSEVFVSVEGEKDFLISNKGRLYNTKTKRFRKPRNTPGTYYYYFGGVEGKTYETHSLVGRHFLPHTGGLILHKEENLSYPEINFVENLWVGTESDNAKDAFSKGRRTSNFISYNQKTGEERHSPPNKGKTGLHQHTTEAKERISAHQKERWRLWRLDNPR
jgi:hypothetical protein